MTLENFTDVLTSVQEALANLSVLRNSGISEEILFPIERGVANTIGVLELAFEDTDKALSYFCFDLDFGKIKDPMVSNTGVKWYFRSVEDLWLYFS